MTESNNATAPPGSREELVWAVTQSCSGVPCTIDISSSLSGSSEPPAPFSFEFDGTSYLYQGSFVAGCFDPATGAILDPEGSIAESSMELRATEVVRRDGEVVVTELRGTRFLTGRANPATASDVCRDAAIEPVTYSVVATLES